VLGFGYLCGVIGSSSLFQHYVRMFVKDYGTPFTVIFFTGFVHLGRITSVSLETLPTSTAFAPTMDRDCVRQIWEISGSKKNSID
jgi:boron transporter